ncbi:hypothetical protein [Azospirillum griseum]|uniref:Uncharacterized protein n=1 Tax=Azospirillum griseum TaxID=2496639 RepID=A0A3S0K0E9_9PROT|nr:hypothetical protein [Azospirillum griseum]RTR13832.1 hypothetical protein EJ903_24230 [Azospirillum griseum]
MTRETSATAQNRHGGPDHRMGGGVARLTLAVVLGLILVIYMHQFGMNMRASSGLPFWDDWGYFFGEQQGVQQPLTFQSLFAKDSDHVAPVFKLVTHALWRVIGVDFLTFRLVGWLCFGAMLVSYAALLLRVCAPTGWAAVPVAMAGFFLMGTANADYFYYQHMGLAQPIFFTALFLYLHAMAAGWSMAALPALLTFGSTGVFGASYALGAGGAAAVLALRQSRGADPAANRRLPVAVGGGVLLSAAMLYLTFHGSYANHTGQPLVLPWEPEFWGFLLGAFANAAGVAATAADPTRSLAVGGALFLAYAGLVPALLLGREREDDRGGNAAFCIAALVAGIVLVTMVTALGRARLCGDSIPATLACGATPRYAFPIIIGLPAVVAGWLRVLPLKPAALRPLAGGLLIGLLVLAHGPDRESLLRHWRVADLNSMLVTRDARGAACIAAHLASIRRADGSLDWGRPLTCPTISPRDIAPYLEVAHRMHAAFLRPLETSDSSPPGRFQANTLMQATLDAAQSLRLAVPATPGRLIGSVDALEESRDGRRSLVGWAADAVNREPAANLLVVIGGRVVAVGGTGAARPDVAKALDNPSLADSGFILPVPVDALSTGERIHVFALSRDLGLSALSPPDGLPPVFAKRAR